MKVTFVGADDWHGIYVDDALFCEGHRVADFEWLRLLEQAGVTVDDKSETDEAYRVIEGHGRCPQTLTEWNNSVNEGEV